MEIFCEEPSNWLDLQNKVAYILSSCGYVVETPKKVQSVRGNIEIDVYAKDSDMLIICECKYWESRVPQNIIFSFRTVTEDIGANKGIIIAKKGFQNGAYKSIQNTNIELQTWEEFLGKYKDKYLKLQIKRIMRIKSKLFRVADDKAEYWKYYDALDEHRRTEVNILKKNLMRIILQFSPMCIMLQNEEHEEIGWNTEYIDKIISDVEKAFEERFAAYSDFFEYVNGEINVIIPKIESIYGIKIL